MPSSPLPLTVPVDCPPALVPAPVPKPPIWEPAVLADLCEELDDADGSLGRGIVSTYLAQGFNQVSQLEGAAAVGDEARVRSGAHCLRGSTLTVGGTRLAELCRQLEGAELSMPTEDAARLIRLEFERLAKRLAAWSGPDRAAC